MDETEGFGRGGTDKKLTSVILLESKISESRTVFSLVPAIFRFASLSELAPKLSDFRGTAGAQAGEPRTSIAQPLIMWEISALSKRPQRG